GARQTLDLVGRLTRIGSQVAAVRLAGLAHADALQAARQVGMTSTGAWLRTTGQRAGAAHRDLALAHDLQTLPATRGALGQGAITAEHAAVVAQAIAGLPEQVGDDARGRVEQRLLDYAGRMDPTQLAKEAPGVASRVDPSAAARLARREADARARRHLV